VGGWHFSIFLITGLAFGFAYACRYAVQIVNLVLFAGIVELIQLEVPGLIESPLGLAVADLLLILVRYSQRQREADGLAGDE
jgi:hypothetical protein